MMDLRVTRTLKSIENTFVATVLAVGFKKVTVVQLAKDAMINPKTFYDHFHDKYDLATFVAQQFLDRYTQVLQTRLQNMTVTLPLTAVVTTLLSENDLKRTWQALTRIKFDNFDFRQQLIELMQTQLAAANLTHDPLALAVLPACAFETLNYYIESGEPFTVQRQQELLRLVTTLLTTTA